MSSAVQIRENGALVGGSAPGAAGASEPAQYLTFMLEREMFALGILSIREIIEFHELTPVPMMPEWIRGVINLRGAVVPVIDLAARFGRPPQPVTKRTCIVVAELQNETERQIIGVVVDAVSQVLAISAADIEPPPAFGAKIRVDFMEGLAKVDGKFVIVLNVDRVLSIDELSGLTDRQDASPTEDGEGPRREAARLPAQPA